MHVYIIYKKMYVYFCVYVFMMQQTYSPVQDVIDMVRKAWKHATSFLFLHNSIWNSCNV